MGAQLLKHSNSSTNSLFKLIIILLASPFLVQLITLVSHCHISYTKLQYQSTQFLLKVCHLCCIVQKQQYTQLQTLPVYIYNKCKPWTIKFAFTSRTAPSMYTLNNQGSIAKLGHSHTLIGYNLITSFSTLTRYQLLRSQLWSYKLCTAFNKLRPTSYNRSPFHIAFLSKLS